MIKPDDSCNKHITGDRVEVSFYLKAENGYDYTAIVRGTIIRRYDRHIGADFHCYEVLFDAPPYPNSKEILVDMMEYNLKFLPVRNRD